MFVCVVCVLVCVVDVLFVSDVSFCVFRVRVSGRRVLDGVWLLWCVCFCV